MGRDMLLSVVVPIYNVSEYLEPCIDSILAQTYQSLEILLIDDGSTDSSPQICDEYAKQDCRIHVIHQQNGGLVQARKTGVEQATGEVIAFVDGDDWIEEDIYYHMMKYMDADVDMVTAGLIFDWKAIGKTKVLIDGQAEGIYERKEIEKILPGLVYDKRTGRQLITTSVCNKLFSTGLLKEVMPTITNTISYGEDGALVLSFAAKMQKLVVTHWAKYHYMQHEASMIRKYDFASFQKIYDLKQCMQENLKHLPENVHMRSQIEYYTRAFLENTISSVFRMEDESIHFIFPYECIEKGARIVLYGAGNVGKAYYKCIQGGEYANVVMWVDSDWKNKQVYAPEIESPGNISETNYDYIVIAIENEKIASEIMTEMRKQGVPVEKMIWKKPFLLG